MHINNPFEEIATRLSRIELFLLEMKRAGILNIPSLPSTPDQFGKEQALQFLRQQGIEMSESKLYKLTASKNIPFKNFGRKLIFDREELLTWVKSQTINSNNTSEVELTLAKSARRKSERRIHA